MNHDGAPTPGAGAPSLSRPALRGALVLALVVALLAVVATVAGCGGAQAAGGDVELRVFAAASLTEVFTELGDLYAETHPDVKLTFNFAGSQDLAAQLRQGAGADVFASASMKYVEDVADLVEVPQVFAANELQIAVAPGNPLGVAGLADLAGDDLKVVLGAPEVPAGRYALEALEKAGVSVDPVSLENTVKGVVTKVSLGEADAGVVYVTDVVAAAGAVAGVVIPAEHNVTATYPLALVCESENPEAAQEFIDFVLSPAGQQVLAAAGFSPAEAQ